MANTDEKKPIMFCLGDKRELEGITGEEYEYIQTKEGFMEDSDNTFEGLLRMSYLEVQYDSDKGDNIFSEFLMEEIRNKALKLGADAIINFKYQILEGHHEHLSGVAYGTPVRKK